MAVDKAKGPEGADEDITAPVDAASNESNEDDGYTSNADEVEGTSVDAEQAEPEAEPAEQTEATQEPEESDQAETSDEVEEVETEPRGEELGDEDLKNPEPFELAEDDEELEEEDDSILSMFEGINDEEDEEKLAEAEEEAAEMASSRPVRKGTKTATETEVTSKATATEKKNRPTRTRAQATQSDAPKKTGPVQFVGQVVQELKKVSWPTSGQLWQYFVVVLIFVVFMIAFIGLLDVLFGWSMLKLFS